MEEIFSVEEFNMRIVPTLVGQGNLTAVFASYREIGLYGINDLKHELPEKPGLRIIVQSGNLDYSLVSWSMLIDGIKLDEDWLANLGKNSLDAEANEAQKRVEQGVADIYTTPDENKIFVVYAGDSAFETALKFAVNMKRSHAKSTAVVVTCNCTNRKWKHVLLPLLRAQEIDYAVTTPECGCRQATAAILEHLVELWPTPVSI